jgi:NADH dehydrogenase (ubiquinone) 1 beta subcomplex subunit 9
MFDANMNESNPKLVAQLLRETEVALAYYYHPNPYKFPTAPGGTKWERNVPVPEEMVRRGVTIFDNN